MATNGFRVKNSLNLSPVDLTQITNPQAGDLACDINDSNKIKRYDANSAAWTEVGSGGVGGTDILFVQDFESASLSSFTQTGLSLSQTDPLHGKVSALLTHQAAVNQSFKQVIAVDRKFRGETMVLRLNVKSNASAGNVTLNIYDETNAANIVASEQLQLSNDVSGVLNTVSYTIPSTCASLSYTVTALPEAGSPVTRVDDIISELAVTSLLSTAVEVPVITSWQGYTPTFQGFGTPSAVEFEWRQVGEDVEIRGKFTSGTSTGVEARVGLPAGLTSASTAIIPSLQMIGSSSTSGLTADNKSVLVEPNVTYVTFGNGTNGGTSENQKGLGTQYATGVTVSFFAKVPCAGLSATTTKTIALTQSGLVQGADSNLILSGNAGQVMTVDVTNIPFANLISSLGSDIGSWNGSQLTVASNGVLSISCEVNPSTSASRALALYVNGTYFQTIGDYANVGAHNGSYTGYFLAGDVLSIRINGTGATLLNTTTHKIIFAKQSSLKQIAVSSDQKLRIPTSELRFEGASTRGSTATAIVRFDSVAKIRGDAFTVVSDAVNGTAITMTKAGRVSVTAGSLVSSASVQSYITLNQSNLASITLTNAEVMASWGNGGSITSYQSGSATFDVKVGDIIRVASTVTPTASQLNNFHISFQEQDIAVSVTNVLPQFSDSDSSVRVTGSNGYGSSGTAVRRFSNVEANIGSDIEYVDSATNGASFTIKSAGIYHVSFTNYFNQSVVSANSGISKNASSLSTSITSLSSTETLAISSDLVNTASTGPRLINAMWSGYLSVGDIIRPHADGTTGTSVNASFTMSKVGKPNVTGVDVTPFVNIPQPRFLTQYAFGTGTSNTGVVQTGPLTTLVGDNLFTYDSSNGRYTFLKDATATANFSMQATSSLVNPRINHYVNSTASVILRASDTSPAGYATNSSATFPVVAGDYIYFDSGLAQASNSQRFSVYAEKYETSNQILTAPETFSTDTASLTYAPSSLYTLSTLNNAPVGTFITFTYAINSNTRTQTTTAPTQTTADMNTNGIQLFTRAYNAASTAASPAVVAIQIGKGLKGKSLALYKSTAKATSMEVDYSVVSSTISLGFYNKSYNEITGILYLDAAFQQLSANTTCAFAASDGTSPTNGYLVINASKNVSLVGIGLNRVYLYAANNAGQVLTANVTNIPFITVEDTHGAWNGTQYTVPETGIYSITGHTFGGSNVGNTDLYVNAAATNTIGANHSSTTHGFAITKKFNKGEVLSFRSTVGFTLTSNAVLNHLEIAKVGF
jgi:hypothetical protein